ncbi:hypothetical protein A264_20833, partial [Pseudomonas syringae pv. actinidiae ICMP 19071]|uniref:DUF6861 domain-containing protein n=2 Tax=Pseudomonas syringae TaxID=317 RepID=UPI0003582254
KEVDGSELNLRCRLPYGWPDDRGIRTQMAMIIAGSALAGGLTGAGAGLLLGGVSAVPMGAMGAALGVQASMFILSMLGLKRVAESFEEGLPRILDYYQRGIKTAWEGPRGESGLNPFMGDDPLAQNSAVQSIAQGHVEVVILLLGAIAHYLTRGRGDARILAQDMQVSAKGARLGQWMLKHEDALKRRPDLQRPEPRKGAFDTRETNNPSTAAPKALRRPQADPVKPPTVSPKLVSPTYRESCKDSTKGFRLTISCLSIWAKCWATQKMTCWTIRQR